MIDLGPLGKSSHTTLSNTLKLVLLVALSVLLMACETVSYYSQAARGQLNILMARQSISDLLADEQTDPELRRQLRLILEVRNFAAQQLRLPVADNYLSYVDLNREHAVWNVFAAPEFSVEPATWCYPIAGCVSYRGYFSEQAAFRYAASMEEEGYDTYLGGVDAYSTLGWFDDSVFSTVLGRSDHRLAGLIFHELAHQVVYVPGDTTFNESFASAVERIGLQQWLRHVGQPELIEIAELESLQRQEFVRLVSAYRDRFRELYQRELGPGEMREEKQALQQELRFAYQSLPGSQQNGGAYRGFFEHSLNNAQLSTVSSYNDLLPNFMNLFDESGGDWDVFYGEVRALAALDHEQRRQAMGVTGSQ